MRESSLLNKKELSGQLGEEFLTEENKASFFNKKELLESKILLVDSFVNKVILEGHLNLIPEFIHENIEIFSASGIKGRGFEIHKKALNMWLSAFDVIKNEKLGRFVDGDFVINHWKVTAFHKGEFAGFAPTNKEVTFTGVNFYKVLDNKIVSISGYTDFGR